MDPQHQPEGWPYGNVFAPVPSVAGSVMRHGGAALDPYTGLTIASDRWIKMTCTCCGHEAMTPIEALTHIPWVADDGGDAISTCGDCSYDIIHGRPPGHGRRRRRGRRG